MLVEYTRNVCGIREAQHAETSPEAERLVVTALECSLVGEPHRVRVLAGTRAAELYGSSDSIEDYFCNYGLNPAYRPVLEQAGLRVSGVDDEGGVRIVELERHPFFVATLFCFQTRSRPEQPHPLVAGFVAATARP